MLVIFLKYWKTSGLLWWQGGQGAQVSGVYFEWDLSSMYIERVSGNPGKHS